METAYLILASVTVFLWLPILLRFYRTWLARKNPISLAICASIVLIIWEAIARIWIIVEAVDLRSAAMVFTGVSTVVGVYFNVSFLWANKKFDNSRRP